MPKSWNTKIINSPPILLTSVKDSCDSEVFCPSISITVDSVYKDRQKYLQESIANLQTHYNQFKLLSSRRTNIYSKKSYQVVYLINVKNTPLACITTWIFDYDNEVVYIITEMASNEKYGEFLKYKDLFLDIASSIKINN